MSQQTVAYKNVTEFGAGCVLPKTKKQEENTSVKNARKVKTQTSVNTTSEITELIIFGCVFLMK